MSPGTQAARGGRNEKLEIGGKTIEPGQTVDLKLKFSETYLGAAISIPVRVIRAEKPGPRLFVSGAIHGDELTGIGIIRELLFGEPPELVRGTLICLPVVNLFGLQNHSRYAPDRRDLNRCFPGSPHGSISGRLAHAIFGEVISLCDYGVDFHSAAVRRTNYPNVRADMRNPKVKALARAFGSELIVNGRGPEGSLRREAVARGIPTIILEAGEIWKIEPGIVESGVRGLMNVLNYLDMIEGAREEPLFQITIDKTQWVRAERGGFLIFHARPGQLVEEGQVLATNVNIFGRERNLLHAPARGIVIGMATMPAITPGEPVYHIATLSQRTYKRIRDRIRGQSSRTKSLFDRVRTDLSTNVMINPAPEPPEEPISPDE